MSAYSAPDIAVAIDLNLSEDLIDEGLARELINRIQNLRKEADLAVTDRIEVYVDSMPERIKLAISHKEEYIKNETLMVKFLDEQDDNLILKEISIGEDSFLIGLKKAN